MRPFAPDLKTYIFVIVLQFPTIWLKQIFLVFYFIRRVLRTHVKPVKINLLKKVPILLTSPKFHPGSEIPSKVPNSKSWIGSTENSFPWTWGRPPGCYCTKAPEGLCSFDVQGVQFGWENKSERELAFFAARAALYLLLVQITTNIKHKAS